MNFGFFYFLVDIFYCYGDMFVCWDGEECILRIYFCDGVYDCFDGFDEYICGEYFIFV